MSDGLFVDASALCAIILDEAERDAFKLRIVDAGAAITSPLAIFETAVSIAARRRTILHVAEHDVHELLEAGRVRVVPITSEIGRAALLARARYGKGSGHPAQLNLGDCFSYACAKAHAVPLLYKGDDFIHTDLA